MILLLILIYVAIGAFIAGYCNDTGESAVITTIWWPVILAGSLVVCIASLPYKLGRKLSDFKKEKNNETN